MAPLPLEGIQTPVSNSLGQGAMSGGPQEGNRGGMMSLAMLIDFIIQRTYHELTVLAELLPRKTDMERKIEIYNFSTRTRQLFVRLLALVKWANSASKVEKSARIMVFLDKQSLLFVETADMLARMARETLVQARLPNFHIPAAVEVLTTGTYGRLPACIKEKIVPPDPITPLEKKTTLVRLNQIIQHRLVTGNLLPQMRNLKIENGRVTFTVQHEFEVVLTLMGDGLNIPWRLLEINILVKDKETGDGKALVHPLQIQYIHQLVQARLVDNPQPLGEVYNCLHYFCQSLQLEVLYSQALRLMRDRLDDHIHVDEYIPGRSLTVSYWRDLRSEIGYKLTVQVDHHNPTRPLTVLHVPSIGNKEAEIADRAIRCKILSMERLLVHTIYVRTRSRLEDIKLELQGMLKDIECTLQGSPAILSVAILQPCLRAEQLLITVDTHTGMLLSHVPQYDAPLIVEINNILNGNHSKLPIYISELRYWLMQRRCEKTLQHLPAAAHERLPLLHDPDHPIMKIGKHHIYIRFHRHNNVVLIVEFKERENNPCRIDCSFYMCVVKHSSIEDNRNNKDENIESEIPKVFLKVETLIEFDTFVATHGPFTAIDGISDNDQIEPNSLKRKLDISKLEPANQRVKKPAYFIVALAHVVAMCDERLPYITLAMELTKKEVYHNGVQIEANATGLVLKIIQLPPPTAEIRYSDSWVSLLKRLLSVSIRVVGKNNVKSWMVEFVFFSSPLISSHAKEQFPRRPIYFQYEMLGAHQAAKTVESLLNDWWKMVHLYTLVHDLGEYLKIEKYNFFLNLFSARSYNYGKLVMCYGPDKSATVAVVWECKLGMFKMTFGTMYNSLNAHSIIQEQLESHLNEHRNLAQLIQILTETYEPLVSLSKLPTLPQLGVHTVSHKNPVQTFTLMAQSCFLIRITYQGMYCLELSFRGGGLVAIRDGAYSRFDTCNVVSVFFATPFLKTFLSKYIDENAVFRRRSQSEDDNPPSPVEIDGGSGFLTSSHRPPQSPAGSSRSEPSTSGLRFHPPLTPPSISNPHTPASPHTSTIQPPPHNGFGSSPATSFNLASPNSSMQQQANNINPSPMLPHPSPSSSSSGLIPNSPLNPQLSSPGGLLSNSSPGSQQQQQTANMPGHSPVGYIPSSSNHNTMDGSPFPVSQQQSPAASNWPGSPGMPRPSPVRPGQSPVGGMMHHSPQQMDLLKSGVNHSLTRVLPSKSWAGAVPTLLTHEALETLCCPSPHPLGIPGPEMSPLERFLGCVFMRKQLQRHVQTERNLSILQNNEPGVTHFKVNEMLQCKVGLNTQHLQGLHIKISHLPEHKEIWTLDELHVMERFFETRVAAPPYKPTTMFTFCTMLNCSPNVLKDFIQIMRLDMFPELAEQQGMQWSVQFLLRIPSIPLQIVPAGTQGVLECKNKTLFFVQISKLGYRPNVEPPSIVLPLIYDNQTNVTQVAQKDFAAYPLMAAAHTVLRNFCQGHSGSGECTIFPALRELLMNLTFAKEQGVVPQQVVAVQQIQSPAMSMAGPVGNPAYLPPHMQVGMMGPQ